MHPTKTASGTDYVSRDTAIPNALDRRLKGNLLINGDLRVWQRGTSFVPAAAPGGTFTADRWHSTRSVAGSTVSRQTGTSAQYALRVQRDSGNASTAAITLSQSLESADCIGLAGLPVTFKMRAKCGANYSPTSSALAVIVASGTGTDQNIQSGYTGQNNFLNTSFTLSTTQAIFEATATIPSGATELCVYYSMTPTGTAGAADWFEIEEVQLVVGDYAGNFPYRSFAEELALCQRYFQKSYDLSVAPGTATSNPGSNAVTPRVADQNDRFPIVFKTRMRDLPPTVTLYNYQSGASGSLRDTTGAVDRNATTENANGMGAYIFFSVNPTANNKHYFHWAASAEL